MNLYSRPQWELRCGAGRAGEVAGGVTGGGAVGMGWDILIMAHTHPVN